MEEWRRLDSRLQRAVVSHVNDGKKDGVTHHFYLKFVLLQ